MTKEELKHLSNLLDEEIKMENLSKEESLSINMSMIMVVLILSEANFPFGTKFGNTTLRLLLRACELVEMKYNETENNPNS